jgi:hypothetical protein
LFLAEREGFEPPVPTRSTTDFESRFQFEPNQWFGSVAFYNFRLFIEQIRFDAAAFVRVL